MMDEIVTGRITAADRDGVTIRAPLPEFYIKREYNEVLVQFVDARPMSNDQRKKAWAIMQDVARWAGTEKEETYNLFRWRYTQAAVDGLKRELFQMHTASMTEAREFINYLVEFVLDFGVPMRVPLYQVTDDIAYYMRQCLLHKRCAVCGQPAQLHHVDRVGSHGGSREKINHLGLRAEALCAIHHAELHSRGQADFDEAYHLEAVPIDRDIARAYRLNTKERRPS